MQVAPGTACQCKESTNFNDFQRNLVALDTQLLPLTGLLWHLSAARGGGAARQTQVCSVLATRASHALHFTSSK